MGRSLWQRKCVIEGRRNERGQYYPPSPRLFVQERSNGQEEVRSQREDMEKKFRSEYVGQGGWDTRDPCWFCVARSQFNSRFVASRIEGHLSRIEQLKVRLEFNEQV